MDYEATKNNSGLMSNDEEKARRNRLAILIAVIVAVLLCLVAGGMYYFGNAGDKPDAATEAADNKTAGKDGADKKDNKQGQTVTVVSPGSDTVVRSVNATGTLAARREIPVGVVGEGGRVTRVYADAGDWVKKGQPLVAIDSSVQNQQAAGLRAQIGVAKADLNLAEGELSRALQLVDRGFISKADVDRRTANRDAAKARVSAAQAQYQQTLARNARLTVYAPVSGYVLERRVETGQNATGGSGALFRIAKGGEMELQAQLGEADLANMSVGVSASVTPVGSDRIFNGQIWQVSPQVNPQTRQGIARISLPFDRALKPGGFASVEIKAGAMTATMLPESAIQNDKEGSFVYIVDKENKAVRRNIQTGSVTASGVPIIAGLTGNEKVVLFAGGFLNPGEVVTPKMQKKSK